MALQCGRPPQKSIGQRSGRTWEKDTKTHQHRRIALDPETLSLLSEHRHRCGARAAALELALTDDAFVFSLAVDGSEHLKPDSVSQRYARLARRLGISTTIHKLRHYSATELISAGVDVRTVAGRLGHGGGGTTTLKVYTAWVSESDQRAATSLFARLPARPAAAADQAPRHDREATYERIAAELRTRIASGELPSIPKDLTRNCSNGIAYAVADHVANDGLLGSGTYRQGIRATELRPGEDRGTAVATGLTANRFELVNGFYIPFDEDRDDVTPVITRAMALLAEHGRPVPTTDATPDADAQPALDHLADIHTALRAEKRVRTQVVLARLAELNPAEYEDWTFQDLAAALAKYEIEPAKSHGVKVVRADDVTQALTERDELGDEEPGT
ncbi:MAG: tyrosine-type recombinase/integrase [Pseudonocardiaceae bacterium]